MIVCNFLNNINIFQVFSFHIGVPIVQYYLHEIKAKLSWVACIIYFLLVNFKSGLECVVGKFTVQSFAIDLCNEYLESIYSYVYNNPNQLLYI